jgi:hypothetical protein
MPSEIGQAVVEFRDGTPEGVKALANEFPGDVTILRASGFNADDPGITEVLIALTPVVVQAVVMIVREQIASRRHVSVKVDGIELTGVSEKTAVEVLEQLTEQEE